MSNPLIMDYVKDGSRGKATALQTFGSLFGEVFASVVLMSIANSEVFTYTQSYAVNTLVCICLCAPLFFIVKDVTIKRYSFRNSYSSERDSINSTPASQRASEGLGQRLTVEQYQPSSESVTISE